MFAEKNRPLLSKSATVSANNTKLEEPIVVATKSESLSLNFPKYLRQIKDTNNIETCTQSKKNKLSKTLLSCSFSRTKPVPALNPRLKQRKIKILLKITLLLLNSNFLLSKKTTKAKNKETTKDIKYGEKTKFSKLINYMLYKPR